MPLYPDMDNTRGKVNIVIFSGKLKIPDYTQIKTFPPKIVKDALKVKLKEKRKNLKLVEF